MNWKEVLASYPENEDMVLLYEEWSETPYLRELFALLTDYQPEWNKEKELGNWAAEFILDLLEEAENEIEEMDPQRRINHFREMIEERYEDFRNSHQFVRVNNVAIQAETGQHPCEDIRKYIEEEGEKIGFPILI